MRVALDTNLWTFLAECDESRAFESLARRRNWRIVLPPATLLEASWTKKAGLRRRILKAMTHGPREHIPSEAEFECLEVVEECRRLHPEWVRPEPINRAELINLHLLWTVRIPRQAKHDPDGLAVTTNVSEHLLTPGATVWDQALENQRANQQLAREAGFKADLSQLAAIRPPDGSKFDARYWVGVPELDRVGFWRFDNAALYWEQLSAPARYGKPPGPDTTLADWIEPYVDVSRLRQDRGAYNRFWYIEADPGNMLRNWLRSAVKFTQLEYKISHGNPGDEQQAAYLPDCDFYLTCDRRFSLVLDQVRRSAPRPVASIVLVEREGSAIANIDKAMASHVGVDSRAAVD